MTLASVRPLSKFNPPHAECKYSDVSATPLLEYLGRIPLVFRCIGHESSIPSGSLRAIACFRGRWFTPLQYFRAVEVDNILQSFTSALHNFEDALLHFVGNPHMNDIRGLLGVSVVANTEPEPSHFIKASHHPALTSYDFQKICSVLSAYRFFEILSLRAQCALRVPLSSSRVSMFLPGPPSTKDDLDVSVQMMS